ncbi:MAG: 50S ribosome-binding GTPase [Desulfovibrio sp.]|nr:50S ribosome-binding GTPase [Desulfovibrio sp.]
MATSRKITPTLAVCGGTGAGKSSLVNALVHADVQAVGVTPTTRETREHEARIAGGIPVYLMDTPGMGEASRHEEYAARLREILPEADVLLWVVGYDNRALDLDVRLLREVREAAPDKPLLILGNAVDRASRSFNAAGFDPSGGSSPAEKAVGGWLAYLREIFAFAEPAAVLPCAAGEFSGDTARQYNLQAISARIEALLPEAMRLRWLAEEKATQDRHGKAEKMILAATATAGAIGLIPLPVADMPFIVTTQVALILGLCSLHGRTFTMDTARSLSLAAISAVAGPMAFQALTKLVPGFGSVVGAGVAAACTYAVGTVTQTMLESGLEFDVTMFKAAVKDVFNEYRNRFK